MTTETVLCYDAIGANVATLPKGAQVAGYTTGSGPVPWTQAQFGAHPGAVRIDQDPSASDPTADVLDVEGGAATLADCPRWAQAALAAYKAARRKGQRSPAIYTSASNVTGVANALLGGGVHSGVGLWVANWNLTQAQAETLVRQASGPFPVIGVQFRSGATTDTSVLSKAWLETVSGAAAPASSGPYGHSAPNVPGESLWKVAADRHTSVDHIRAASVGYLTPGHLDILDKYIALGEAMRAGGMLSPVMPTGLRYATDNP